MKVTRRIVSWILAVLLVINPLVCESVAWAADAADQKAQEATDQAQNANTQVQGIDRVSGSDKAQVQNAANQAQADQAANQAIASEATGTGTGTGAAATSATTSTMDKLSSFKAKVQKGMIKVGQILQKVGGILKTVGQALMAIGAALSATVFGAAIGAMLVKIGKVLYAIGTALEAAGKALEKMGSDAAGLDGNFSQNLTKVFTAAKEGYQNGRAEADQKAADAQAKVDSAKQQINQVTGGNSTGTDTGSEATPAVTNQPEGATQSE